MPYLSVVPRPGRDYNSRDEVLTAWNANEDFVVADVSSPWDGKLITKGGAQLHAAGTTIQVRYKNLTRVMMIGNRRQS